MTHPWTRKFLECLPGIHKSTLILGYSFDPWYAKEVAEDEDWPKIQAILLDLQYQTRKDDRVIAISLDILLARLWDVFPFK